jgi:hypothetical protein
LDRKYADQKKRRAKEWAAENPQRVKDVHRRAHFKRRYGLSLDDYKAMLERQGGRCAICGREPIKDNRLCVDHDHMTGKVRALLCDNCNMALGSFNDDVEAMAKAIRYVEEHRI